MAVRGWKSQRSVQVGATPVEIAASNRRRLGLWLRNTGKRTIYLGATRAVDASAPIALAPGESFREEATFDAWWGCADGKDAALAVIEILR